MSHLGFNEPDAIDAETESQELANAVCLVAAHGKFEISLNGTFIRGNSEGVSVYFGIDRVTEKIDISKAAIIFADIALRSSC